MDSLLPPEKPLHLLEPATTCSTIRWGNPSVRNVMSRSRETVRGLVNDPKGNRFIATESEIERRLALSALHWSVVEQVTEQPLELKVGDPEPFSYTPDFCLKLTSGQKLIVEVKPAATLATNEPLRVRLTKIAHAFEMHRLLFCVVTERDFNAAYHISNLRLLKRYLNFSTNQLIQALEVVQQKPPNHFSQLMSVVGDSHLALALIAQKFVSASLQSPLCGETPIQCGESIDEPAYFQGWHPTENTWQDMDDNEYNRQRRLLS